MKISGVHVSIQWFAVLLVITLLALLASVVAEKLDNPVLAGNIATGIIVMWLVIGAGGAAFAGGMISTKLIEKGAEIGANRDKINVEREAIAAHAANQMAKGFQLGYQMTRSLPDPPMLPMGDDNLLPPLDMWRAPMLIESGEEP